MPSESLGLRPGSVVPGRDREVHGATHNWPSVGRVREGLVGRDLLVSSRTSDSVVMIAPRVVNHKAYREMIVSGSAMRDETGWLYGF